MEVPMSRGQHASLITQLAKLVECTPSRGRAATTSSSSGGTNSRTKNQTLVGDVWAVRMAFGSVLSVALLTAGAWVYAIAAERHAERLMQTTFREPTPELRSALAAGAAADADDLRLVRGR